MALFMLNWCGYILGRFWWKLGYFYSIIWSYWRWRRRQRRRIKIFGPFVDWDELNEIHYPLVAYIWRVLQTKRDARMKENRHFGKFNHLLNLNYLYNSCSVTRFGIVLVLWLMFLSLVIFWRFNWCLVKFWTCCGILMLVGTFALLLMAKSYTNILAIYSHW